MPFPEDDFEPDPTDDFVPEVPMALAASAADDFEPEDDFEPDQSEPGWLREGLAFAARTLPPIAAGGAGFALGGPLGAAAGGAVGGALGETIAQQIESPASPTRWLPVAGEAALGAVPLGRAASTLGRVAERFGPKAASIAGGAIEGGLFGAGATAVQTATREGRAPTPQELAIGAASGGLVGGALGRAKFSPEAKPGSLPGATATAAAERLVPEAGDDAVAAARAADIATRQRAREARGMVEVLSAHEIGRMSDAVMQLPREVFADSASLIAGLRSNRVTAEALAKLEDHGVVRPLETAEGATDLMEQFRFASSNAGMTMQKIAPLAKVADILAGKAQAEAERRGFRDVARDMLNTRRALMVQLLGNQIRNVVTAGFNIAQTALARVISGTLDPQSMTTGFELARTLVQPRRAIRASNQILDQMPMIKDSLMRYGVGETDTENIAVRWARTLNLGLSKVSETHPRLMTFAVFARDALRHRGLDYEAFERNAQDFIAGLNPAARASLDEGLGEAVQAARAITFADDATSRLGQTLIRLTTDHPWLTLEVPFPRYVVSAAQRLTNYSPLGMLRLFAPDVVASARTGERVLQAADPAFVARRIGEAAVGTGMLAAALSLRMDDRTRGEKFYEMYGPGIDQPIDLRAYGIAPYAFLADAMLLVSEGKSLKSMPFADLTEGLLGLSRIGGLSSTLIAPLLGGNRADRQTIEGVVENLETTLGEVVGSFTIPFREIKDIIGDQRSVDRQVNQMTRLLGPTVANVPLAAEFFDFPQSIKITTGRAYSDRRPVTVFGTPVQAGWLKTLGISTVEKDHIERTLQRIGIDARGDPVEAFEVGARYSIASDSPYRAEAKPVARLVSQRANQLAGPTIIKAVGHFIDSPAFAALQQHEPENARTYLLKLIGDIREAARFQAEAELRVRSPRSATMLEAAKARTGATGRAKRAAYERQLATRFGAP